MKSYILPDGALTKCAIPLFSRKFFSEWNTAKSVSRSNRWLHVTLNFVQIFSFSGLPKKTGHLDMCYNLFWPFCNIQV